MSVDSGRLIDARLGADSARAVYRSLLDSLARPGRVVAPVEGVAMSIPPALLPLLTLADLDVTFSVLTGDDDPWTDVVASVTGARPVHDLGEADIVTALRSPSPGELERLRIGDAFRPEHGSRLVVACGGLLEHPADALTGNLGGTTRFVVSGPGATPPRTVEALGCDPSVLEGLGKRNRSFPAGVDAWLVASDGSMIGLPRSSRTRIIDGRDTASHLDTANHLEGID